MKKKEKSELTPKAAEELRRIIVRFEFTVKCYEEVYEKTKPEEKTVIILAIGKELKKMEDYFLTLNELEEITPEDRLQMTKVLREKFYELMKCYI